MDIQDIKENFENITITKMNGRPESRRDIIKKQYIEAAERIIRNEGTEPLSIRRLGTEMNLNSATLYTYFEDLEELLLFVTFKFRKELLIRDSKEILPTMNSKEQYLKMYEIYCDYSFKYPEMYYNMYFGKASYKLDAVLHEYYRLFPDEFVSQTRLIKDIVTHGDVYQGEILALQYLAEEGFIKRENIEMVANIVVRVHASYMRDLCTFPGWNTPEYHQRFMKCVQHILDTN